MVMGIGMKMELLTAKEGRQKDKQAGRRVGRQASRRAGRQREHG
jgi:hypothetical protein